MTHEAVVFAAVGPYVDSLTQLIWALYRQRNTAVVEAHLVVDERGRRFVDSDLLADGAALEHLGHKLGPAILARRDVFVHEARLSDGSWVADESQAPQARAFIDTLWSAATTAIRRAGARPIVFALVSGRRRTVPALVAACFQMLARRDDTLLDVRLSDRRVEGYGDLFFPEQDEPVVLGATTIDPQSVSVSIVELELPHLAGLLGPSGLESFEMAKRLSQAAIDAASPPWLSIDLEDGSASANGERIPLSEAELVWFAYLAHARRTTAEGWVVAGQDGHTSLGAFLSTLGPWTSKIRTRPLELLAGGQYVADEDLRNLRGKTIQKLKRWCEAERPHFAPWLLPKTRGGRWQRLPLDPSRISFVRNSGVSRR
ncbi:MAG: hypothetical protein HY791_09715 [Deltaproteobacteria bacterium]|nr:hypothetical protein [Deltaproteobacteria bacterium]